MSNEPLEGGVEFESVHADVDVVEECFDLGRLDVAGIDPYCVNISVNVSERHGEIAGLIVGTEVHLESAERVEHVGIPISFEHSIEHAVGPRVIRVKSDF